jgi:HEPN domain-containing protein
MSETGMGNGNTTDRSDYWIELAEYDLDTAKAMQQTGRYLYVGFMCQQTAEKALKAVIAKQGIFPPKIHHLTRLAELSNLLNSLNDEQAALLYELYPFNIEACYPLHKDKIAHVLNQKNCKEYISKTEEFLQWIKQKL